MKGLIFILALAGSMAAQPKPTPVPAPACTMKAADLPEVHGLKLGMPELSAAAVIGEQFRLDAMDGRIRNASLLPKPLVPEWEDVSYVSLEAYRAQIYKIYISYKIKWEDAIEYGQNFAPKLGLPLKGWEPVSRSLIKLSCSDFVVMLDAQSSSLMLTDRVAAESMKDESRKAEEAKKKALKP